MGTVGISMTGSGEIGDIALGSWSVQESATPASPAEPAGGVGNVHISALRKPTSKFIVDNDAVFTHASGGVPEPSLGTIRGTIGEVDIPPTTTAVNFDIAPLASLLVAERVMPPTGQQNLSDIISGYVSVVTDRLTIDWQATTDPVRVFPGWKGEVWRYLNALCSIEGLEIATTGATLVIRDVGSVVFDIDNSITPRVKESTRSTALKIPVRCYHPVLVASLGSTKYNYSQNPSLEVNATGWAAVLDTTLGGTGGSITSTARSVGPAFSGAAALRVRMTDYAMYSGFVGVGGPVYTHKAVAIVRNTFDVTGIADGDAVSGSVYVLAPTTLNPFPAPAPESQVDMRVEWLDASSTVIGTSSASSAGINPTTWSRVTVDGITKVPGATQARISARVQNYYENNVGTNATNRDFLLDAAFFTNGAMVPYFDGSTAGASWVGTAGSSASLIPIPAENDMYNALKDDNSIYSVNVGETQSYLLESNNYPTQIAQPIATSNPVINVGQYFVSGADNLPVLANEWLAYGGNVFVSISTEIPGAIDMTLTGPTVAIPGVPGPYSLSASNGQSEFATLSIAGIGVVTTPEDVVILTSADPAKTTTEFAPEIDWPFFTDRASIYDSVIWAALDAAGPTMTLSFSIPTVMLKGFGLTEGALVTHDGCIYRITTVSIAGINATINARWYTTLGAFDAQWIGQPISNFDTLWTGYSAGDIEIEPLRRV